jgi:hypothetical protein
MSSFGMDGAADRWQDAWKFGDPAGAGGARERGAAAGGMDEAW